MDIKEKALVLIVDDNPANIQVVGEQLRIEGYEIAIATDGKKAISIAESRNPHLILLDIMMPEMDGFEVCEILKSKESTKNIPVIFLTAKIEKSDLLKGFSVGAVDYITKPFNFEELLARVETHTKLKLYSEQIEQDKIKLEKLNFEKNHFLSIAAHDLKNPLFSISMIAKVLIEENLEKEEINEFAGDIITTSKRMLELIKNLLDINAIENGKIKADIQPENVFEIVKGVYEQYIKRAKSKGISLHFDSDCKDQKALADENAILQISDNLISNAIKFSPFDKNIFISIKCDDDFMYLKVKDEGPGITPDDMKKLFGKFTKLSATPTADENSTGLGLSIVKQYANMMNGDIWCVSQPGEGAEFILKIPLYKN
jgi:two-component system sensor histidine kinase/response regulator